MNQLDLLSGIRVLELSEGIAGAMCGKVLSDLGAEVIKVESESDGRFHVKGSAAAYQQLDAHKQIIYPDIAADDFLATLQEIFDGIDFFVTDLCRKDLSDMGLDYPDLQESHAGLIYCYISGWGVNGPLKDCEASELSIQIASGMTRYLGSSDGPPVRQGFDLVSVNTGIAAAQAALAAYLWRHQSHKGQRVEVSMLATAVALMQWSIAAESKPDAWQGRQVTAQDWPPDHGFLCADTRCFIDLHGNTKAWPDLLREIGCPELAADPRFNSSEGLDIHGPELPALTAAQMKKWAFADLEKLVREKYDGTIVPVLDLSKVLEHPQIEHLGMIIPGEKPTICFPMEMK